VLGALAGALTVLALGAATAVAAPVSLLLPQSTAFSSLGHSCGGIQEQSYATGFDPLTGNPTGDVYVSTRCGGSGRGGGYHVTIYSAWVGATWDLGGNLVSSAPVSPAPSVDPAFTATDANGDTVSNSGGRAYLTVPAPGQPTGVAAVQVGDQFQVTWTPAPPNPAVITSSTVTATPDGSAAPVVTATVTGQAASASVGPLQPSTAYQITVVNTDGGGSSPASNPITVTTAAASVVPSAPTGVKAVWASNNLLFATWKAAVAGDSPVDQYQIQLRGSDGGGTFTQTVDGSTLSAFFSVSDVPDWSVIVRAHNGAGWGPWSARYVLGGD
jgi:Fibronectin type III domain